MNEQSSPPDWRDPFAPDGAIIEETYEPLKRARPRSIVPQVIAAGMVVAAVSAVAYYYLKPAQAPADGTVIVGLPKTVMAVAQIDVPSTLEGIDAVLEMKASGALGALFHQAATGFGASIPLDQVEYVIAAVNEPTRSLFDAPHEGGIETMLFYLRFKTPQVAGAVLPAETPSTERSDGTRVYDIHGLKAVLVDDRTWLICPENMLLSAQYAYREQTQPDWLESMDSDEPVFVAGRIAGLSNDDPSARYEVLVTASFGDPCVVSGRCTTPRHDQAQQMLDDLQQSLDADYDGLGPTAAEFFDQADLALDERTVNFEGTIPAAAIRVAMEPITRMLGPFAQMEGSRDLQESFNALSDEVMEVEPTEIEQLSDSPAPPEAN